MDIQELIESSASEKNILTEMIFNKNDWRDGDMVKVVKDYKGYFTKYIDMALRMTRLRSVNGLTRFQFSHPITLETIPYNDMSFDLDEFGYMVNNNVIIKT